MKKNIQTLLTPFEAYNSLETKRAVAKILHTDIENITEIVWKSRSIDARKYPVKIHANIDIYINQKPDIEPFRYLPENVSQSPEVHIVGAGPAGYFAALELIEKGLKPVILERGKNVSERKRDIALISQGKSLNTESNYSFGEGGAGTFSDGKLFTRTKKRDEIQRVINLLHKHGADSQILFESHPHIGTDKLPEIIENIRKTIIDAGGIVLFNHKVTDFKISGNKITEIEINNDFFIPVRTVILATGNSARDIYELLNRHNILMEPKGFAMGIRIEHQQELINSIQYNSKKYDKYLPAASYSIAQQVDERGVYSFCMCPGGIIVPATTEHQKTVVNGMSNSKRNSIFANSGFVVELQPCDFESFGRGGVLSGIDFQSHLEELAYKNGEPEFIAPAQRMLDFVQGKTSKTIPPCSYNPGVVSSPIHKWLPPVIGKSLQKGFFAIGKRINGFLTNDAVIVGVESRTSSPVKIIRDKEKHNHINIKNLYPCGEGAGYAGGIVSSAIDGILTARKICL